MPLIAVTTYYLEMLDPRDLRPKRSPRTDLGLACINPPMPELNRFFYTAAGAGWYWHDRLPWTYQDWHAYLNRPELETWMLTVNGTPAGYFELEGQPDANVEVAYFGLLPAFVGKGLGGHLQPRGLGKYIARGLRQYKQETCEMDLPAESSGPWPGAGPIAD